MKRAPRPNRMPPTPPASPAPAPGVCPPGSARCRAIALGRGVAALLLAAVAVIVLGAAYMTVGDSASRAADGVAALSGDWYAVSPASFDLTISASGELESREKVEVKSQVHGRPAIIEIVDEGTFVEEGDLLFRLESDETANALEQATLDAEAARSQTEAARQELEIQINETESARRAAEVKLSLARLELQRWQKGELVTRRNQLQLALEKAKRRVERAKRDYELSRELYDQKFISLNELEDAEIEQIEATDALKTAKLNIEVFESYEYLRDKQEYESDVEQAEAELDRTIRKNESTLERHRSKLASEQRQLAIRLQRQKDLEAQLAATEVFAPRDGLVVYASSVGRRRGDPIDEGREVRYGETVLFLPDTRRMVANVRIHEALIGQVELGQEADVVIDARRHATVPGEVISKAVTPEDGGWWNPNLREYEVRIGLPSNIEGLKPAMRCSAKVLVGRVEDTWAVPVQCVYTEGNQRYVHTPAGNGRVRRTPVTIGRASQTLVEVTEGLRRGDHVLLRDPRLGEVLDEPLERARNN